jgi:hypothetical protein
MRDSSVNTPDWSENKRAMPGTTIPPDTSAKLENTKDWMENTTASI